jgi:general secretion pathway protein G
MREYGNKSIRRGFTLVEVLLVIVIIGILAGMLVTRLAGRSQEARTTRAQADIRGQLSLALDLFEQDVGRYPTTDEGLGALVQNPGIPGWKGPYLKGGLKPDPWGTPYSYGLQVDEAGNNYVVTSAGPDLQFGTEDDVEE